MKGIKALWRATRAWHIVMAFAVIRFISAEVYYWHDETLARAAYNEARGCFDVLLATWLKR